MSNGRVRARVITRYADISTPQPLFLPRCILPWMTLAVLPRNSLLRKRFHESREEAVQLGRREKERERRTGGSQVKEGLGRAWRWAEGNDMVL